MPPILTNLSQISRRSIPTALRILVIEDNTIIAMLLETTLADMGHEVCAIESTETGAVAAAARLLPDLLIVDVGLREGNGIAAVDRILCHGFVPHVFVSGNDLKPEMLDPRAVRLSKPYDARDLFAALQSAFAPPAAI